MLLLRLLEFLRGVHEGYVRRGHDSRDISKDHGRDTLGRLQRLVRNPRHDRHVAGRIVIVGGVVTRQAAGVAVPSRGAVDCETEAFISNDVLAFRVGGVRLGSAGLCQRV